MCVCVCVCVCVCDSLILSTPRTLTWQALLIPVLLFILSLSCSGEEHVVHRMLDGHHVTKLHLQPCLARVLGGGSCQGDHVTLQVFHADLCGPGPVNVGVEQGVINEQILSLGAETSIE